MKRILFLFIICLSAISIKAQNNHRIAVDISYNHMDLSYRQAIDSSRFWVNPYLGIANSDFETKYNDIIFGLKTGYMLVELKRSTFSVDAVVGGYIPNNELYNAATLVLGIDLDYSLRISQNGKHLLIANVGCQYGKRCYKQTYSNDFIHIETTDKFKVPMINFSVGYAYRF